MNLTDQHVIVLTIDATGTLQHNGSTFGETVDTMDGTNDEDTGTDDTNWVTFKIKNESKEKQTLSITTTVPNEGQIIVRPEKDRWHMRADSHELELRGKDEDTKTIKYRGKSFGSAHVSARRFHLHNHTDGDVDFKLYRNIDVGHAKKIAIRPSLSRDIDLAIDVNGDPTFTIRPSGG